MSRCAREESGQLCRFLSGRDPIIQLRPVFSRESVVFRREERSHLGGRGAEREQLVARTLAIYQRQQVGVLPFQGFYFSGSLGLAPDLIDAEQWGERALKLGGIKPSQVAARARQPQK